VPGVAAPLLEELRSRAAAAAAEMVAGARVEADAIRTLARDGATRRREAALAAHDREAATALARTRAETEARLRRETLAARGAALDRVFERAEHGFSSLASDPGLRDVLDVALRDALSCLPAGPVTLRCPGVIADAARAAVAVAKADDVSVLVEDSGPFGMMIEAGDGSVAVDGTLARRLARERPRLSTVIAARLLESPR
jgi:vacuolar-type H+-ATPase subunit E/Vma4